MLVCIAFKIDKWVWNFGGKILAVENCSTVTIAMA